MSRVRYQIKNCNGQEVVQEIHKVVVHSFQLSDVEDPDLFAAEPLYKWQESEEGKFVMTHAVVKPEWRRTQNFETYGYTYIIIAELEKKKLSEFYLKFDKSLRKL